MSRPTSTSTAARPAAASSAAAASGRRRGAWRRRRARRSQARAASSTEPARDVGRRVRGSPAAPASRAAASTARDDVVVAGAAAQVALEPVADLAPRSGRGFSVEQRRRSPSPCPGVQKPHCRPWSAWNACCTGCSSPSPSASPSMVVTARPSAWAASTVHDFTDSPSSSTVQAPHDDVSQPTLVPVRPATSRRKCTSSVAVRHVGAAVLAVDGHARPSLAVPRLL